MNTNLPAIVKRIIAENSETVLEDPARVKAFFSDLAKDEPKPLRLAFGRGLEAGAYTALKTAPDAAERVLRKTAIARRLRDEHGLDPVLCAEALDILEAALFGEVKPRILCKTCGRELQESWKACPHCGAACNAIEPPPQPPPYQPYQQPPSAPYQRQPAYQPPPVSPHYSAPPAPQKGNRAKQVILGGILGSIVSAILDGIRGPFVGAIVGAIYGAIVGGIVCGIYGAIVGGISMRYFHLLLGG